MGRGRAKAKQTRVARELKYADHGLNLERLRSELVPDTDSDQDQPNSGRDQG